MAINSFMDSSLLKAANILQERGIDPNQLSKEQLNAFTSSSTTSQIQSIEALLQNLNILTPDDLLRRCHALLGELEIFADLCEKKKNHAEYRHKTEYSHFKGDVQKEVELMLKVCLFTSRWKYLNTHDV
jgi:predicted component of type VI protein secretion system